MGKLYLGVDITGVEGVCWEQADFSGTCKQNWPLYQVEALYVLSPQFFGTATLVASETLGNYG